jgi:alkylation response protein AidB-like acyl-CoA dehydrogenase
VFAELRRGINLAGVLDRRDDRPGWPLLAEHLTAIADAGFTAVRVPVRWWGSAAAPLHRVDALVGHARTHGLAVVLTMHHADVVYASASTVPGRRARRSRSPAAWRSRPASASPSSTSAATALTAEPIGDKVDSVLNEARALLADVPGASFQGSPGQLARSGRGRSRTLSATAPPTRSTAPPAGPAPLA